MTHRILIAGFRHETNTFSKLPTDMAAFEGRSLHRGAEIAAAYRGTKTEVAAFFDACARHDWTPVPAVMADATPSGKVTRAAFEALTAEILAVLDEAGPVDGLFLPLHGAMVTEHADDGEGALLEAIRAKVGREVPIAVTLDLHANVTGRMAALADIIVSYRTYPHVDQVAITIEALDLLARTLAGEIAPKCSVARGALLDGVDHGRTTAPGPMTELLASAARFCREPGVLSVSINAGFPWADIRDAGPSAVVVGDGENPRYPEIAEALMAEIWDKRHRLTIQTVSVAEAMEAVKAAGSGAGPVVLADYADNPGGGGYGDSVGLLGGMIEAGLENAAFATLYDPEAAALCARAGEGAAVALTLGGKLDPRFGALRGEPTWLSDGSCLRCDTHISSEHLASDGNTVIDYCLRTDLGALVRVAAACGFDGGNHCHIELAISLPNIPRDTYWVCKLGRDAKGNYINTGRGDTPEDALAQAIVAAVPLP